MASLRDGVGGGAEDERQRGIAGYSATVEKGHFSLISTAISCDLTWSLAGVRWWLVSPPRFRSLSPLRLSRSPLLPDLLECHADKPIRVKVGGRFCRIAYQRVAGQSVYCHPSCQHRDYVLDKLIKFPSEHDIDCA